MSVAMDVVRMVGQGLAIGENAEPTHCPFCLAEHEEKFSVKRVDEGYLYNCFRGKCGAAGFVSASKGLVDGSYASRHSQEKRKHKKYDSSRLKALEEADYAFFEDTWGLREYMLYGNIFLSPDDEYVFRIRDNRAVTRGWHVRQPIWKGVECHRLGLPDKPKGMTYKDSPEVSKAAWFTGDGSSTLVIVEDYLSAMKVRLAGYRSLCLFGTVITDADKREIRQSGVVDGTVLWLDADAQEQAYRNLQRHGVNLNMRVVSTLRDPKTLTTMSIREVIG